MIEIFIPSFVKGGLGRIFKIPLNPPLAKGDVKSHSAARLV